MDGISHDGGEELRLEELENCAGEGFEELDDTDFGGKGHPDAF